MQIATVGLGRTMGKQGGARRVIAIVAKAPRPGEVKTRLCPPLSVREAAELHRAFLTDKIEQVRSLPAATRAVVYTPDEERGFFERVAPDFVLIAQTPGDLGARLAASFDYFFADGYEAAVLIDSDSPTLPREFLLRALDLLVSADVDVVLGPTADGGYYLIGLRAARPELFTDMPWSSSRLLAETASRARALGLRLGWLPPWFDVDTAPDLERLASSLRTTAGPTPRHTRRFLDCHAR
jgi:rSAM/selenodomain-associated transferase 1